MARLRSFFGSLFGGLQWASAGTGAVCRGGPAGNAVVPDAWHNTGGPRSRTRRERITSSIFPQEEGRRSLLGAWRVGDVWAIDTPGPRWRPYVLELLAKMGFSDPDEAFAELDGIPRVRLHCRPSRGRGCRTYLMVRSRAERLDWLAKALVLGKCCRGLYDPERPVVWTEQRLRQCYELHEIGDGFYENDS